MLVAGRRGCLCLPLGFFTVVLFFPFSFPIPIPVLLRAFSLDHASTARRPLSTSTLGAATVAVMSLAQVRGVTGSSRGCGSGAGANATVKHVPRSCFWLGGEPDYFFGLRPGATFNFVCGRALLLPACRRQVTENAVARLSEERQTGVVLHASRVR